MNANVPAGAAILLDFIGRVETGKTGPEGYGVIYANKQNRLAKPLTEMTVDEVQAAQAGWAKAHGSSAAGRYQFMRTTLRGLVADLGIPGGAKFNPDLQDRLGYELLKRRGYANFAARVLPPRAFGNQLAMEWASLPVLMDTNGAKRKVRRGETYYAGDGVNKVLTSPEQVEDVLTASLVGRPGARPEPAPIPPPPDIPAPDPVQPAPAKPTAPFGWIATAILFALAIASGVALYLWG